MLKQAIISLVFSFCIVTLFAQNQNIYELYAKGLHQQVIEQTNKLIEENNCEASCLYYRGNSFNALYRYNEALKAFQLALKLQPDSLYLLKALANAWEQVGNDDKAIDVYNRILMNDSLNVQALTSKAMILKSEKEYIKATELFSKLVKLDTTNSFFYYQLALCTSRLGLSDPASSYFFSAYKLNTNNFNSVKGFLNELVKQKYYEDAEAYIDSFLYAFPDNLYLLKQRAFLSAIGGNYLKAVEEFKKVVERGDSSMFTCKYYGQSLYNNGNYGEAVVWLSKYLEHHPEDSKNLFICGLAYQKDYQYQKSLDCFSLVENKIFNREAIAQLAIERAHTLIAYGDYYGFRDSTGRKKKKYYKLGLDSFMQAEELNSNNEHVYKELGNFYNYKMKDAHLALYYYQIYYNKLNPNKINEYDLIWIQDKIGELKEEVHFLGQ